MECSKAVVCAEGLHNGGEKQEQDSPCEANPQSEEGYHRFRQQHLCRPHERYLEQGVDGGLVQLGLRVYGATGLFAQFGSAFLEDDVAARLAEDEVKQGYQRGVVYDLNVVYPRSNQLDTRPKGLFYLPSPRCVQSSRWPVDLDDGTPDKGPEGDACNAGEAEERHGQASRFVAFPDVADAATDDVDGDG